MTESQTLLAEYARSGSETAFRELVTRYLGLVYGAALRLVDGDAHLAEDVAQTVFMDLARKARGLSSQVMLGGWLHQRAYNVAAPMMRAQRRRQAREREAVQMNALQEQDNASTYLAEVAPLLDEAITQLGTEDRNAILLRFFERRDFRSIGEALGSTEDAARMRVSRALEKLHALLKCRGVTLSAAALGTALASESLTAAPAGLAVSLAASVLASSAAGAGFTATVLKILVMTKLKAGILAAVVVAGTATSLVVLQQARAKQREQDDALRQQSAQLAQLTADNERLSGLATQATGGQDQLADLQRLRAEAETLRQRTSELAKLREQARRLQQQAGPQGKTPEEIREERIAKANFSKQVLLAFRMFANDNQDLFPTSFAQATPYFPTIQSGAGTNVSADQFEVVYQGSAVMTNAGDVVVLCEKQPWQNSDGKWCKVYGMADGSVQTVGMPSRWRNQAGQETSYETFEAYEKDHIVVPPNQ